jgi:nucleoside diphosphate kinase
VSDVNLLSQSRSLTAVPSKVALYSAEPEQYLLRGLTAASESLGPSLLETLEGAAMLVVKPDLIATRQVMRCISLIKEEGFAVIRFIPFTLRVDMAHALWRFQFNALTESSKDLMCKIYCRTPSLLMLLRDRWQGEEALGCTRLALLKGSCDPNRRDPASLRSRLNAPNKVLDAVHCPDESIDLIRELTIFFSDAQLGDLYYDLRSQSQDVAFSRRELEELYKATPTHDLSVSNASMRLRRMIALAPHYEDAYLKKLLIDMIEHAMSYGTTLDWSSFSASLQSLEIDPYGWDAMVVASQYIDYDQPGSTKLVTNFSDAGPKVTIRADDS